MNGTTSMDDSEKGVLKSPSGGVVTAVEEVVLNASGHHDALERQYGLFAICSAALAIDSAWMAFGGSVVVAIFNGGSTGVLWELLTACAWYSIIALGLAEFASSIPSSGGVYHWATALGGKSWGPVVGYAAGAVSWAGWVFNTCAICQIPANVAIQLYAIHHPDYVSQPWQVYIVYLMVCWSACAVVVLGNSILPRIQKFMFYFLTSSFLVTVIVLAAMPKQHATSKFVWADFINNTGFASNGVAFMTGVLNGCFTIGTPDSVTHFAEELPNPRVDLPKAIAAQMILGTFTSFTYGIALMYSISDLDAILGTTFNFPVASIYLQATNNNAAATSGLLVMFLFGLWICLIGAFVTCGRSWWTLARDGATPFPRFFGRASKKLSCPVEATIFQGVLVSAFGAIQIGSKSGFTDLVSSFILLSTISYAIPTAAHVVTGRKAIPIGPFWLGKIGFLINSASVLTTIMFIVFFCFPFYEPVTVDSMNYTSVILAGYSFLAAIWWFVIRKKYVGPKLANLEEAGMRVKEAI